MPPHDEHAPDQAPSAEQAPTNPTILAYTRALSDDPDTAFELLVMASEIVDDFDDYGPVIQADEQGEYTPRTAIERLRAARDRIFAAHDSHPPAPHLWHSLAAASPPRLPAAEPRSPSMSTISLSERDGFIATFDRETATTLRLMREFPPASLELKPAEKSPSARELLWVLSVGPLLSTSVLKGVPFDPSAMPKPPESLPGLIASLESAKADTLAALRASTGADFDTVIPVPSGPDTMSQVRRGNVLWTVLYDHIHHRGQLSVYQRIAGGKVPSIYGPSADEPW